MAAQEFRVQEASRRDHLIALGSSLFFLIVISATLWARPQMRTAFVCAVSAAAWLFFAWTMVRELQALLAHKNWPVVIDEHGVRYASPGQITWAEISGLEPVRAHQRVDLRDAQGRVRVSLPYELEDAHEVVQFVADMLADRWPEVQLPHNFVQDPSAPMLAAAATLIAALGGAIYWIRGRPLLQLLGAIAMVLVLAAFALWRTRSVRQLTVGKQDLGVTKGMRRRLLNYADIESVGLFVVGGKAERHLDVKVTFRDSSADYVLPWRCDPFEVYAIVKKSWERGRPNASAEPPAPDELESEGLPAT
jgi:hypothetical protein